MSIEKVTVNRDEVIAAFRDAQGDVLGYLTPEEVVDYTEKVSQL